jgi:hypothetical protein
LEVRPLLPTPEKPIRRDWRRAIASVLAVAIMATMVSRVVGSGFAYADAWRPYSDADLLAECFGVNAIGPGVGVECQYRIERVKNPAEYLWYRVGEIYLDLCGGGRGSVSVTGSYTRGESWTIGISPAYTPSGIGVFGGPSYTRSWGRTIGMTVTVDGVSGKRSWATIGVPHEVSDGAMTVTAIEAGHAESAPMRLPPVEIKMTDVKRPRWDLGHPVSKEVRACPDEQFKYPTLGYDAMFIVDT